MCAQLTLEFREFRDRLSASVKINVHKRSKSTNIWRAENNNIYRKSVDNSILSEASVLSFSLFEK